MKKKNLKSLNLNKTVISNLNKAQVNGGNGGTITCFESLAWCFSDTCISTVYEGPVQNTCAFCNHQ